MMRLFAIARNAFVETVRQPIYLVLILVTFAVLVLDLPLSGWTMGTGTGDYKDTDQKMMVNLGLSTLLVSGLFLAAFSAAGVLSREIEDKTILTVISKPVGRPLVVLGKFLGVSAALIVAFYLCSLVFLMTVRHQVRPRVSDPYDVPVIVLGSLAFVGTVLAALFCNYFFGWQFTSASVSIGTVLFSLSMGVIAFVGKKWEIIAFGQGIPPDLLVAMLLILFGVLVFAAVAVAASTRLGQIMTLLVCCGFFFVGSMTYYLFGRFAGQNLAARLANWALPNLTFFYALDALTQNRPVPLSYAAIAGAYAAFYIAAILALGMILFQRRELEAQRGAASAPRAVSLLAWLGRAAAVAAAVLAVSWPWGYGLAVAIGLAAALAAAAVVGWLYWGWFGRGVKWTYYVALACSGPGLVAAAIATVVPAVRVPMKLSLPATAACAASLAVWLAILLLPRTRHHFGLVRRGRSRLPTV